MGQQQNQFAANLQVGDLVAIATHNPINHGDPYFIMQVSKLAGDLGVLALEGKTEDVNLFCRLTGRIIGQRDRQIDPVTTDVRDAVKRSQVMQWIITRAEFDLLRLPAEKQRALYEMVNDWLATSAATAKVYVDEQH